MVQDRRSVAQEAPPAKATRATASEDLGAELRGAADDVLGAQEWKSSKLGYLSGMGAIAGGFRAIGGAVGSSLSQLRTFYNAALGRGSEDDNLESVMIDDASERFLESMRLYGKTLADVDAMQNRTWRGCLFFAGMTLVALAYGMASYIWSPPVAGVFLPFDFAYRFITVAPLAAFALKWGYTNWMLRRRRYDTLIEYLRSGEWAPQRARANRGEGQIAAKPRRDIVKRAAVVLLLAGVVALATAVPSYAQSTPNAPSSGGMTGPLDIFVKPGAKDLFMNMLSMIAPNVGPVPGFQGQSGSVTPAHTAMATGFMAFISALFFLAGMQVCWHTISGIVATAHEGKVLGQRWHEIWAPVRVVSGVGFLAPALGGFCVAQVVVLYLIAFGGQMANLIWTPYVETMVSGMATPTTATQDQIATTIGQLTSTNGVLKNIFEKELCYATAKQNFDRRGYSGGNVPANVTWGSDFSYTQFTDDQKSMWSRLTNPLGGTPLANGGAALTGQTTTVQAQTLDYGRVCGKITVPQTIATAAGSTGLTPDVQAAVAFSKARVDAITQARADLQSIAQKAGQSYQNYQAAAAGSGGVTGGGVATNGLYFSSESSGGAQSGGGQGSVSELMSALQTARGHYENTMKQAALSLMSGVASTTGGTLQQFTKDARDGGWATAGVYYMTISRIQSSLFARASEMPTVTKINMSQADESLTYALNGWPNGQPGPMPEFTKWWNANVPQLSKDNDNPINPYGARAGISDVQNTNIVVSALNMLDFNIVAKMLTYAAPNPLNPLGDIIQVGHTIINSAYVGLAALVATNSAGNSIWGRVISGDTAPGALSIMSPLLIVLLLAIFAIGITMAFIIPMIPYIMVLFFIIGMLVLTLEAMIAAPLWAFFHVRMDGQDLIDQVQRPGYMIAFNLLLRPALMMLGYIMSFFAFGAIAWFINVTFGSAVTAATAGYYSGPITFIVMGGMMAFLYYQAAIRCFTMIVQVPDRVTRWFGVGGENLGEEQHGHAAAGMVVGQIGNRVESSLAPSVGNALSGKNRSPNPVGNKAIANGGGADSQPDGGNAPSGGSPRGGGGNSPSGGGVRGAVDAGAQANDASMDMPAGAQNPASARSPIAEKGMSNRPTGGNQGIGGGSSGGGGSESGGGRSTSDGYSAPASAGAPDKGAPNAAQPTSVRTDSKSGSAGNTMNPGSASRIRPRTPPSK
jgi:conjugal transfer/type IV secretion protein DotA/TraY